MGAAIEVITAFATNPGAALTATTIAPGDSKTVRSFPDANKAWLASVWSSNAAGGQYEVFSQRMHDTSHGIRHQIPAGDDLEILGQFTQQQMYPNDPLTINISGGGAETDIMSLLMYYDNLPGVDQTLASWADIKDRIVNYMGLEVDLTSGGTQGNYGGSRALNQDFPQLKAGVTYALLGYTCKTRFATLGIRGSDTGNTRVGGPGSIQTADTIGWFKDLSDALGRPCIPLIQANNAASTTVDLVAADTATAHPVSFNFAQLK